jgi:hypothetical protein
MKTKKLLATSLLCGLCAFSTLPVHAAEPEGPYTGIHKEVSTLSDGKTRVSWGEGELVHANPVGRKPWAYAKTYTFAGNAHSIKARTKCKSNGQTDYTSWAEKSNASSVSSATLVARTESDVKFNGEHKIQDTSTSGWQTATTSVSY